MQSVIEKILSDARKDAEIILNHYEKEIAKLKQEYEEKFALAERKVKEEIEKRKKEEIMRTVAQIKLEYKRKITSRMQAYIDEVLQSAIKKLPENKNYLDFLKRLIKNSGITEGELYLSDADIKKYHSQIEKFMKQEGYNFIIKSDNKSPGGVVIRKEKLAFLGSTDVIAEIMKEDFKIMIARALGFV